MKNEEKLKQIIANVFEVEMELINNDSSQDSIENWDSIHQLNLVFAIEESFDVQLTDEDAVQLLSYQLIKVILEEKGIDF